MFFMLFPMGSIIFFFFSIFSFLPNLIDVFIHHCEFSLWALLLPYTVLLGQIS